MEDLFLKYKQERENVQYIQVEGAFITYKMLPEYVYIEDFYCIQELRGSGIVQELATKVEEIAKKAGYKKMLGSIVVGTAGAEKSLVNSLKHGYKLLKLDQTTIWIYKEIE